MSDLAKLCSDKLCKSAFQKILANNNKKKKKVRKPTTKRASKWSQYATLLK